MNPPTALAGFPSRDDSETIGSTCPVFQDWFVPVGRQRYCQPRCRKTAHRRRRPVIDTIVTVPENTSPRERTVYQCTGCDGLQLGIQRCDDCGIFGRSLGLGGHCPHCDEPVTLDDLGLNKA